MRPTIAELSFLPWRAQGACNRASLTAFQFWLPRHVPSGRMLLLILAGAFLSFPEEDEACYS
jgi:hypothetical protein